MKFDLRKILLLSALSLYMPLYGCSTTAGTGQEQNENTVKETLPEQKAEYERNTEPGSRTVISMEEAVQKKNAGESFVLLYTKEDCSYCASFNEVLEEYLPEHKLDILEVDLTQAEQDYSSEDREAMQNILTGGISKTPALYYIENPQTVWMLDHSETNYSADGLDQWVIANRLDEIKS